MKLSDILQTKKLKNMFGKYTNTYETNILGHCVTGKDKKAVESQAVSELIMRNQMSGHCRYIPAIHNPNVVFIMYYGDRSWCYDILHTDTFRHSTCIMAVHDENEALKRVNDHAENY